MNLGGHAGLPGAGFERAKDGARPRIEAGCEACAATPAPATAPWFMPRLNPVGAETCWITRIDFWVSSATSKVSSGVSSM